MSRELDIFDDRQEMAAAAAESSGVDLRRCELDDGGSDEEVRVSTNEPNQKFKSTIKFIQGRFSKRRSFPKVSKAAFIYLFIYFIKVYLLFSLKKDGNFKYNFNFKF